MFEKRRPSFIENAIANLSPEMTRGSITGQVKALSMIVALRNFIPDRPATSSEKKSPPAPIHHQIYEAACPPRPAVGLNKEEDSPTEPASPGVPRKSAPSSTEEAPPSPGPSQSTFEDTVSSSEAPPVVPPRPRFCSRHENGFLYKKESLGLPPLRCQSAKRPKNIKFYKLSAG